MISTLPDGDVDDRRNSVKSNNNFNDGIGNGAAEGFQEFLVSMTITADQDLCGSLVKKFLVGVGVHGESGKKEKLSTSNIITSH